MFGCDLHLENDDTSFDGTLFRFPLRTKKQADTIEINLLCYDNQQMRDLLLMFVHRAGNLRFFTQNVLRVGIYHLHKLGGQNPKPSLMFEVIKSKAQGGGILRELKFPNFTAPQTALKLQSASKLLRHSLSFRVDFKLGAKMAPSPSPAPPGQCCVLFGFLRALSTAVQH